MVAQVIAVLLVLWVVLSLAVGLGFALGRLWPDADERLLRKIEHQRVALRDAQYHLETWRFAMEPSEIWMRERAIELDRVHLSNYLARFQGVLCNHHRGGEQ